MARRKLQVGDAIISDGIRLVVFSTDPLRATDGRFIYNHLAPDRIETRKFQRGEDDEKLYAFHENRPEVLTFFERRGHDQYAERVRKDIQSKRRQEYGKAVTQHFFSPQQRGRLFQGRDNGSVFRAIVRLVQHKRRLEQELNPEAPARDQNFRLDPETGVLEFKYPIYRTSNFPCEWWLDARRIRLPSRSRLIFSNLDGYWAPRYWVIVIDGTPSYQVAPIVMPKEDGDHRQAQTGLLPHLRRYTLVYKIRDDLSHLLTRRYPELIADLSTKIGRIHERLAEHMYSPDETPLPLVWRSTAQYGLGRASQLSEEEVLYRYALSKIAS